MLLVTEQEITVPSNRRYDAHPIILRIVGAYGALCNIGLPVRFHGDSETRDTR